MASLIWLFTVYCLLFTISPMTYQRTIQTAVIKLFAVYCLLCAIPPAFSQMKSDPTGCWGGTMTTEAGTSGIEIKLAHAASRWNATMKLRPPQGREIAPVVQELELSQADISFTAQRPHIVLKFAGKFDGDKLAGTVEVYHDGNKIRSGTFALAFGVAMPAR
jgi:hypothetical protein